MDRKGPRNKELGSRRYGLTQWRINPRVDYLETPYGCEVGNIEIDLDIKYIYPNWLNREQAHPQVVRRWDGFYQALMEYEEMHAQNGVEAANELATELLHMYSNKTCKGLEYEVNSHIERVLQAYLNHDKILDQRTEDGKSKGVWLP